MNTREPCFSTHSYAPNRMVPPIFDMFFCSSMMCVGRNPESDLVEIVEIPGLKWYIGTQYHPEYQSTVLKPHPLFMDFVKTAIENKK